MANALFLKTNIFQKQYGKEQIADDKRMCHLIHHVTHRPVKPSAVFQSKAGYYSEDDVDLIDDELLLEHPHPPPPRIMGVAFSAGYDSDSAIPRVAAALTESPLVTTTTSTHPVASRRVRGFRMNHQTGRVEADVDDDETVSYDVRHPAWTAGFVLPMFRQGTASPDLDDDAHGMVFSHPIP